MDNDKPKAGFAQLRPGQGKPVAEGFMSDATFSRFEQRGVVLWDPSERMPLDVFSYLREASFCFCFERYLATIVLASATVEIIMNRDSRTKNHPRFINAVNGWAPLNNENLSVAEEEGLPIHALLGGDETVKQTKPIHFVENRNK